MKQTYTLLYKLTVLKDKLNTIDDIYNEKILALISKQIHKIPKEIASLVNGQGYTALSRMKSLDKMSIVTFDPSKLLANPYVVEFYENIKDEDEIIIKDENISNMY